jgi:hypothetical protein
MAFLDNLMAGLQAYLEREGSAEAEVLSRELFEVHETLKTLLSGGEIYREESTAGPSHYLSLDGEHLHYFDSSVVVHIDD